MRVTLKQIRYVCEVAHSGSIHAAAQSLHISPSSVLAGIAAAEEQFGAKIFSRHPARGVQVTPAGRLFITSARRLLEAEAEFDRTIDTLSRGIPDVVRIGCGVAFGGIFLAQFLSRFVRVVGQTKIVMFEGDQHQLQQWLSDSAIDVAIAYADGVVFGDSVSRICKVPSHAVMSATNPLAVQPTVSVDDLTRHPFVLLERTHSSQSILSMFEPFGKRPDIAFRSRSYETVRSAIAAGFGVSLMNMRPVEDSMGTESRIVRRPISDNLPAPVLVVADMYGPAKPQFVRRLVDLLRQFFVEIGPSRFCVTTTDRESTIFDV